MEDYSLIPTWEQVAAMYKYAPGRGDLSDEEWAKVRAEAKAKRAVERKEALAKRKEELSAKEFARMAEKADRAWTKAEAENNALLKDRSELPGRNIDILFNNAEPATETYKKIKEQYPTAYKFLKPMAYLDAAYEQPQNVPEAIMSGVRDWLRIPDFGGSKKDEEAEFDAWLDNYIQEAGSSGTGLDANSALAGTPFPELAGYNPDWKSLKKAIAELKAPEYKTAEYDPLSAIAVGLSNVDWNSGIVPDFSGAVNKMVAMEEGHKKDKAEAENKTSEAKYQTARQNLANLVALESIREKSAARNAEIALARWNAMQPKALGGNKMSWRDSAGNLHFEAIDKHGEARTLGSNEGMADILALGEKGLKNLTPQRLAKMAEKRALLIGDKASQIPYRQGYILQANEMLNAFNRKE